MNLETFEEESLKRFALLLSVLALTSCQKEEPEGWKPAQPDVATPYQRAIVNGAVADIQDFSDRYGMSRNFRWIEIRVVKTFSHTFSDREVSGVCYPGTGSFIEVKDTIFDDAEEAWNIVIHELGHCVLSRVHDDSVMASDGLPAVVRRGQRHYPGSGLTVSVMSTRGNRMAPREYYLRELFGLERITSLQELRHRYPGAVRWID